jgi:hypothetical protein
MAQEVTFSLELGDITTIDADVVALKYARTFHAADKAVAVAIGLKGVNPESIQPEIGKYSLVNTNGGIRATQALFIGVEMIWKFRYSEIQDFSTQIFSVLSDEAPGVRKVAMTLNGVNYGLDETEALLAQFKGCLAAVQAGKLPENLQEIVLVERDGERLDRTRRALDNYVENASFVTRLSNGSYLLSPEQFVLSPEMVKKITGRVKSELELQDQTEQSPAKAPPIPPQPASESKPHAFVAMPFRKEMDDVYYYGIQQPLHATGLLCERVDKDVFTGGC